MAKTAELFKINLRRIREERFPSQSVFAYKLGMSTRGYQKYEQGESTPNLVMLDRLAEALSVSPLDLIGGDTESSKGLLVGLINTVANFNESDLRFVLDFITTHSAGSTSALDPQNVLKNSK